MLSATIASPVDAGANISFSSSGWASGEPVEVLWLKPDGTYFLKLRTVADVSGVVAYTFNVTSDQQGEAILMLSSMITATNIIGVTYIVVRPGHAESVFAAAQIPPMVLYTRRRRLSFPYSYTGQNRNAAPNPLV